MLHSDRRLVTLRLLLNNMHPIFWFTGNSGAGKSTLAFAARDTLHAQGICNIVVLDGDEMRATISTHEDLSAEGRRSHNLRVARLAKLLQAQGHIVLVCVIAPFNSARSEVTAICNPTWIYVQRDGLEQPNRPYEAPTNAALTLDHNTLTSTDSLELLLVFLHTHLS